MAFLRRGKATTSALVSREEAFRVLRSNLLVAIDDLANPVVLITSAAQGEGKTSTCVALARSLALAGLRVVLVDMDLRQPTAHRHLGADNIPGCAEVLLDQRPLADCLQYLSPPLDASAANGLYFLPAGSGAADPTELLGSSRTARLLEGLSAQADIVLIDTPPVLPVADTLVVGRLAAGAVLVVEARGTPMQLVNRAKSALTRNQTRILGVVLNKFNVGDDSTYGFGYDEPTLG